MGAYINPGNESFASIRASTYVDKTGLVVEVNRTLGSSYKFTCISRPRRFGKSFAAKALCAYYDRTCDSTALFDGLDVSRDPSYARHLNKYNVISLYMAQLLQERKDSALVPYIEKVLLWDMRREFPDAVPGVSLSTSLLCAVEASGAKFVAVIDEWDAPIREAPDEAHDYLELLRALFKGGTTTDRVFAGAYMTGILPIKKERGQPAVSDFWEYSMLSPSPFASFVGFLEEDVHGLCAEYGLDFRRMRRWYDGYEVGAVGSVYNPYAVMRAARSGEYTSYWRQTAAADTLLTYIDLDFEGLQDDVVRLMAGEELEVETAGFKNDVNLIASREDALTLMVHLGYLTFEDDTDGRGWVRIPNHEIRTEFEKALRHATHPGLLCLVRASDELLQSTLSLDGKAVAEAIASVHDSNYASMFYNDEQALRHTVKMAYISSIDKYARVEELPSGHGLADLVFLPRRRSPLPALVIELKWSREDGGAIAQIRDRDYSSLPRELCGEVLLVGVSYDAKTKRHTCSIEREMI